MPSPTPGVRTRGFERQGWRVRAQIVEYKLEEDEDIHLVLFDRKARDRRAIVGARRLFEARCGLATDSWRQLSPLHPRKAPAETAERVCSRT